MSVAAQNIDIREAIYPTHLWIPGQAWLKSPTGKRYPDLIKGGFFDHTFVLYFYIDHNSVTGTNRSLQDADILRFSLIQTWHNKVGDRSLTPKNSQGIEIQNPPDAR
ncbi:MAG TPA: hypothetical protein DCF33_13960 [Saprospirales bacterium]|nr:hypothetical protein [Saprospirales bacterium]